MSEPLTLAEAVPLGTVHLQRLLTCAGIRSLVIKGPAFVELGVRKPRQSNDIDLLVAPEDRDAAVQALTSAGWSRQSAWYPRTLDDVTYSITFSHDLFPVTVDLHHRFAGLLSESAFEELWGRRAVVEIAEVETHAPSRVDAFVIEALNAMKAKVPSEWAAAANRVVANSSPVEAEAVIWVAESLGARETAAPVIEVLGGPQLSQPRSPEYSRWARESGSNRPRLLLSYLLRRAPWAFPRVIWDRVNPKGVRAAHGKRLDAMGPSAYARLLARRIWSVITR
ncbi:nucleotidyltransferase family protein [Janibacter anophelis]|uniref:nucleotidyltransferase family protein n=1 Tax=Janibacter anophelis TaxID=319054 RepID=UPI003F7EF79E